MQKSHPLNEVTHNCNCALILLLKLKIFYKMTLLLQFVNCNWIYPGESQLFDQPTSSLFFFRQPSVRRSILIFQFSKDKAQEFHLVWLLLNEYRVGPSFLLYAKLYWLGKMLSRLKLCAKMIQFKCKECNFTKNL